MDTGTQRFGSDRLAPCVSVDLEVDPTSVQLFAFAAVGGTAGSVVHRQGPLEPALARLDTFCRGFDHVIGHNILRHDLPHLAAASPWTCPGKVESTN